MYSIPVTQTMRTSTSSLTLSTTSSTQTHHEHPRSRQVHQQCWRCRYHPLLVGLLHWVAVSPGCTLLFMLLVCIFVMLWSNID